MKRTIAAFLAACICLSGCGSVRVSYETAEGEPGLLILKAVQSRHPDELGAGYTFHIQSNGEDIGSFPSFQDRPTCVPALIPGAYQVTIEGEGINPRVVRVAIQDGQRTTVELLIDNAHFWTIMERAGAVIAAVILLSTYVVLRALSPF